MKEHKTGSLMCVGVKWSSVAKGRGKKQKKSGPARRTAKTPNKNVRANSRLPSGW